MEPLSALLAICAGISPVPGELPAQRPVTRSFDVSFDLSLNKRLSKQSWGWWFVTLSRPLWRHRNGNPPMICGFAHKGPVTRTTFHFRALPRYILNKCFPLYGMGWNTSPFLQTLLGMWLLIHVRLKLIHVSKGVLGHKIPRGYNKLKGTNGTNICNVKSWLIQTFWHVWGSIFVARSAIQSTRCLIGIVDVLYACTSATAVYVYVNHWLYWLGNTDRWQNTLVPF